MSDKVFNGLRIALFSLLVVWGLSTLFYYLAVPVHQSVLISEQARTAVAEACPEGGRLCMGWNALFPFIGQTFTWAKPFAWYAGVSLMVFAVMIAVGYMRTQRAIISFRLSPLKLVGLFIASLWLIFTVISASYNNDQPYTRVYEPLPQVYVGADEEGLRVLQENFQNLFDRGCLNEVGMTNHGARVFDMSHLCIQQAFFTMVLPHVLMVTYLLFVFATLGRFLLGLLRGPVRHPLVEAVFSIGLGACGMIVLLWLLALIGSFIGQPIYSQVAGWGMLLVIPALLYKHAHYWLRSLMNRQWDYQGIAYTGALIVGWLLISYLALNFLNVVRPFPIGWDDLGKYVNQPRLLVSYGYFIPQLASFQWEYITSLGFLLFGYESIFGATSAMMFNWMAGLLAVIAVYSFGRLYFGRNGGVLSALLYYAMPLVGHFSYADMKVDNAVFAVSSFSLLAVFLALFRTQQEEDELPANEEVPEKALDWRLMVLAGVFGGFAFSMKPTAIMTLMALGTMLFGATVHWTALIGGLSLAWAIFTKDGRFNLTEISGRVYGDPTVLSRPVILGALVILGVGMFAYSTYLFPQKMKRTGIAAGVFVASFIVTIAPWILSNNVAYGNVIPHLLFTAPNNITPILVIGKDAETPPDNGAPIRTLPPELRVDESKCRGTAKSEELDRYWGYHSGWGHYITLPWRSVMNLDSAGYYVTTYPALLLFPLLLLLPFFWTRGGRWLKWLFIGTVFMLVQWVFFANGIPWYGLGTFFGLVVGLEALVYRSPDVPSRSAAWVLLVFSLMTCFAMRFWQFDQQRNLFEYPIGKVSYEAMRERTIPYYDDIREVIEQRAQQTPDRPFVYRVGTFIPYFIPKNLEVLPVADHQLDFFNCLHQERDPALTLKRLQALGFNSMIFDTNTQTIEQDPNGSLHQKVQMFVDFVNTPGLGLTLPINDPDSGIAFIILP